MFFFGGETTDAGQICISKNNDKIWYTPPDGNDSELVFTLNLTEEDTFYFESMDLVGFVDSVFHLNERKIIRFDINTDWGQNISFIEGVGPNNMFIYPWYDPGFLSPLIVCKFNNNILEYSNDNPAFKDCDFLSSNINFSSEQEILLYPNPFDREIHINSAQTYSIYQIEIFSVLGEKVYDGRISGNKPLQTYSLGNGAYFIKLYNDEINRTFKMLKFER